MFMSFIHCYKKTNIPVQPIVTETLIRLQLIEHKFNLGKSSVSPQTIESGSIAATGKPDGKRSKAGGNI